MSFSFDKRIIDGNGHMHVARSLITSGTISNYLASEVEGAVERGYQPNDIIPIYRDPEELKKALDTFHAVPLMRRHVMVSGAEPQKDDVIGAVMNPTMDGADVMADLTFWSSEDGIEPVLNGSQEELSCGYNHDLDWTPGEKNGLRYAARMFNIRFNHVTTTKHGRVTGARVADEQPVELSMVDKLKFPRIVAALQVALGLKPEQATALDTAMAAELSEKEDPAPAKTEAELAAEKVAIDAAAQEKAVAAQAAQDAAIKTAVDSAVAATHALYAAREAVAPKVGITALDSAEATYRFALEKTGTKHEGVTVDALPALWEATIKVAPAKTEDSATEPFDFSKLFPGASYIRKG